MLVFHDPAPEKDPKFKARWFEEATEVNTTYKRLWSKGGDIELAQQRKAERAATRGRLKRELLELGKEAVAQMKICEIAKYTQCEHRHIRDTLAAMEWEYNIEKKNTIADILTPHLKWIEKHNVYEIAERFGFKNITSLRGRMNKDKIKFSKMPKGYKQ